MESITEQTQLKKMPDTTQNNPVLLEDVQDRIDNLLNYARSCERRFYGGETVDLSGLDRETAVLCEDLLTLSPEEGRQCVDQLQKLIRKIDDIGRAVSGE